MLSKYELGFIFMILVIGFLIYVAYRYDYYYKTKANKKALENALEKYGYKRKPKKRSP